MDRAANIDALTKVRNKRAYDLDVLRLDAGTKPYGIVMVDLNGLKGINDTYGHEKGDVYINTVCQTVCRTFKHSPVYRVGGDEFVVILENDDYENRDALVEQITDIFRKTPDDTSLEPWERGWAAVGCAIYEPGKDENAESVLKRADASMYETKKAMKAERK
ncbi:MAG: GGDEF domain-containing protein [Lachnospiraceae bacterium]|nr:GGDEF domain-containing protein [Lachnospiraceae bacterium]